MVIDTLLIFAFLDMYCYNLPYKLIGGLCMFNIDANEVSRKSNGIALLYLFTFGFLGMHRFYVGKWKTGLIYLLIGLQLPIIRILTMFGVSPIKSVVYQILLFLFSIAFLGFDLFTMAQEAFSDSDGKILLGRAHRDAVIGRDSKEKEEDKMNMIVAIFLFVIMLILFFFVLPEISNYV